MRKIVNGFDQTHFGHLKYVVDVGGRAIIDQSRSLACAEWNPTDDNDEL